MGIKLGIIERYLTGAGWELLDADMARDEDGRSYPIDTAADVQKERDLSLARTPLTMPAMERSPEDIERMKAMDAQAAEGLATMKRIADALETIALHVDNIEDRINLRQGE